LSFSGARVQGSASPFQRPRARASCNFFLMKTRSGISLSLMPARGVCCAGVCFYYNILMRSVRQLPPSLLYIYIYMCVRVSVWKGACIMLGAARCRPQRWVARRQFDNHAADSGSLAPNYQQPIALRVHSPPKWHLARSVWSFSREGTALEAWKGLYGAHKVGFRVGDLNFQPHFALMTKNLGEIFQGYAEITAQKIYI